MESPGERFSRYGTADYLTDEASIAAFLEAVIENADGDAALIEQAQIRVARVRGEQRSPEVTLIA